jgi:raffinose/stachyose/melibiose transport system permease protein
MLQGTSPPSEAAQAERPEPRETSRVGPRAVSRTRHVVGFLGPALCFYVLFMIVPLLGAVVLSFSDWPGFNIDQLQWAGLDNFRELAGDSVFHRALVHNVVLVGGAIVLNTILALFLAIALDQGLPMSGFFRGVFLMPTAISLIVVALVFSLGLSPSLGFVNPFLEAIGLGGLAGEWLGDPDRVLPVVLVLDTWNSFGLYMFLFIARLITIPQELKDAAAVDGAGEFRTIWHVVLPLLRSTVAMVVLLVAIRSLRMFELIYVMTNGGPDHASEVIATWGYFQGFTATRVGYGSAILVFLVAFTFVLAAIYVYRVRAHDDT